MILDLHVIKEVYVINIRNYIEIPIIILLFIANIFLYNIYLNNIKRMDNDIKSLCDDYKEEINIEDNYYYCESEPILLSQINDISAIDEIIPIYKSKNRWDIELTSDEIDLLANIVYLEAGNQCQEGQMAVVEVIFNRMIDSYYKGSLEEVLSRPGQFSTWKNRNIATPTEQVYEAIDLVLNGESNILSYEALYFARGSGGRKIEKKIQDHVFCK